MTDVQEYCLRWNNHQSNLVSSFHDLRLGEDFVDVTLACEGQTLQAHKVVLSACSPFFRDILKTTPCRHPVIVLRDILFSDLVALIEFMYLGEIRVKHHGLPSFLKTAEVLRVRGLTESASKLKHSSETSVEHSTLFSSTHSSLNPSFSKQLQKNGSVDVPQLELPLHSPSFPSTIVENTATDSIGLLAEVKVEEVDLDSASEDDEDGDEAKRHKQSRRRDEDTNGINKEINSTLQSEEDGLSQPSLTLQSFARIPSIVSPEGNSLFNPETSQDHFRAVHDERIQSHDLTGAIETCENNLGRAPGRMSSSDRPRWPCPFCMRLLSSRSSVRRHIEDRHTNDTSRHPCPLCERLYRTRNSLQYHLSTAHRDREPGPRGRPRTRPRTPPIADSNIAENKNPSESEVGAHHSVNMPINMLFNLNRSPTFGLPPN